MARIAGSQGRLYVDITGSGSAAPIAFLSQADISFSTDKYEVTAYEDGNKTYVAGKEDTSGSFSGFYDSATAQLYTAATDGSARKFYLYPDATVGTAGPYWYGTAFFDFQVSIPVSGAVSVSGNWNAASDVTKIG